MADAKSLLELLDTYLSQFNSSTSVTITKDLSGYTVANTTDTHAGADSLAKAIENFLDSAERKR